MTEHSNICHRILNNIEILKNLSIKSKTSNNGLLENENNNKLKNSISRLQKTIEIILSNEEIYLNIIDDIHTDINIINQLIIKENLIIKLIQNDIKRIKSIYLESLLHKIINNINFYVREDLSCYMDLKIEHIEQFHPEKEGDIFLKGNKDNKNKDIIFELFNIFINVFNSYKENKEEFLKFKI